MGLSRDRAVTVDGGVAPVNTVAPTISGTPTVGQTLTATSDGTWTGTPSPTLARNWQRDGSDIAAETGTTYVLTQTDAGTAVRLRVTGTNTSGSATAYSTAATIIDADAAAYSAALGTPLTANRLALVSAMIAGMKSDGVWTLIDRLALLANETAEAALRDVKQPTKTAVATLSPTFTTDRGYTGNATDAYVDMGETWNAAGNAYALNSASVGVVVNAQTDATARNILGTTTLLNTTMNTRGSGGNTAFRVNTGTTGTLATAPTSKIGHWAATRRDATNMYGFKDGALLTSAVQASTSVASGNVCVLRANTTYDNNRVSAFWWGQAMSDAQMLAVHTRLTTYMTAIGA
jgi:hypothetical protein